MSRPVISSAYDHDPRHYRFARSLPRASAVEGPYNADPISNHWHDALAAFALLAVVLLALFWGGA